MTQTQEVKTEDKSHAFVSFIIKLINNKDKTALAVLRHADNNAMEYKSWEYLVNFVDISNKYQRLPFLLIAAGIAKAEIKNDGNVGLGKALAACYEDGNVSDQAKAKLRRLLACDSTEEVCNILRGFFSLINAKGISLNFTQLLRNLLKFHYDKQQVKAIWAQSFYSKVEEVK